MTYETTRTGVSEEAKFSYKNLKITEIFLLDISSRQK